MIRLKKRKNLSVGIMISPMIDMSFLLLVFFIVSTMNMNEVKTLPVKLPQASQVEVDTKSLYHVTVLPDGRLFLEDKPLTKEAFLLWGAQGRNQGPQCVRCGLRGRKNELPKDP